MSITGILIAAACVGIVGIFVGLFLGVAGIKFKVEVDEKEEAVLAALPAAASPDVPVWQLPLQRERLR
jgi:electron transport complex protein RnfB